MEPDVHTGQTFEELTELSPGERFVIFRVNDRSFAVPVTKVNRIIRAVNITPVPSSPVTIHGIINLHGETVTVVNFRKKFGFPRKQLNVRDKIIILDTETIRIGIVVDQVEDLTDFTSKQEFTFDKLLPGMDKEISGILLADDEIVIIYDIEKIFIRDVLKTISLHNKDKTGNKRSLNKAKRQ